MELTVWQKIKTGFWLGIGFIVPFLIMYMISFGIALLSAKLSFEKEPVEITKVDNTEKRIEFSSSQIKSNLDDQIKILNHRESVNGNRLLILGELVNNGPDTANSLQLQAELFDSSGNFVYECNEYFSRTLNAGDKENFQIKCGCGEEAIPNYASLTVRVLKANKY